MELLGLMGAHVMPFEISGLRISRKDIQMPYYNSEHTKCHRTCTITGPNIANRKDLYVET